MDPTCERLPPWIGARDIWSRTSDGGPRLPAELLQLDRDHDGPDRPRSLEHQRLVYGVQYLEEVLLDRGTQNGKGAALLVKEAAVPLRLRAEIVLLLHKLTARNPVWIRLAVNVEIVL